MKYSMGRTMLIIIAVTFCVVAVIAAVIAGDRLDTINSLKQQLIVQNVQLTKEMRETKAKSYRDGIIACGNEDVAYLHEQADYYQSLAGNNPLSKLMRKWAQNWTYDDDTLNDMVEDYMGEDAH